MLDKLRAELKEAQAKLARREQLRVMLTDAAVQLNEITVRERTLYEQLQKENADVDVMERTTVTSLFYTLLGKKEEKLEKEQREAQAAKLAYQAVVRELADCRDRIDAMTRECDALTAYIDRCEALREQIREELRGDPATAEQILSLERELTENQTQLREIDEAVDAGQEAMEQIGQIESSLSSAENWGTFDLFAKGGIISSMAKHSALDEAQAGAEQLQIALNRFRTELADVRIDGEMGQLNMDGFLRFADWFFDGLLVDWTVLSHIHDSQASVSRVKEQMSDALAQLDELRRVREEKQDALEEKMNDTVAGA